MPHAPEYPQINPSPQECYGQRRRLFGLPAAFLIPVEDISTAHRDPYLEAYEDGWSAATQAARTERRLGWRFFLWWTLSMVLLGYLTAWLFS